MKIKDFKMKWRNIALIAERLFSIKNDTRVVNRDKSVSYDMMDRLKIVL